MIGYVPRIYRMPHNATCVLRVTACGIGSHVRNGVTPFVNRISPVMLLGIVK